MRTLLLACVGVAAVATGAPIASAAPITFGYTGGFQTFAAPVNGTYDIVAIGASGGAGLSASAFRAGYGAEIGGDFLLTAGETLQIAVGGVGGLPPSGYPGAGGGGGGSFVVAPGNTPLVVAGGGGGVFYYTYNSMGMQILPTDHIPADATATTSANGYGPLGGFSSGGMNGNGGSGGSLNGLEGDTGGAGGGFFSDGESGGFSSAMGAGGKSFLNGLAGGAGACCSAVQPYLGFLGYGGGNGGFGGGGGGGGEAGGGGGGYSGGGGGFFKYDGGGGGGSYNGGLANTDLIALDGLDAHNLDGLSANNGLVTINLIATSPANVPEPGTLALLALPLGAAGLIVARRRKRGSEVGGADELQLTGGSWDATLPR